MPFLTIKVPFSVRSVPFRLLVLPLLNYLFSSYGEEELEILHNFYGNDATDEYNGREVRWEK